MDTDTIQAYVIGSCRGCGQHYPLRNGEIIPHSEIIFMGRVRQTNLDDLDCVGSHQGPIEIVDYVPKLPKTRTMNMGYRE